MLRTHELGARRVGRERPPLSQDESGNSLATAAQKNRKNPRAQVSLVARYRSPTAFEYVEEECHDLSAGGVFIKSVAPSPVGTLIKLECDVDRGQATIKAVARVVWAREQAEGENPPGMGVKFVKLEPGGRELIQELMARLGGSDGAGVGRRRSSAPPPASGQESSAAALGAPIEIGRISSIPVASRRTSGLAAGLAEEAPAQTAPEAAPSEPPPSASSSERTSEPPETQEPKPASARSSEPTTTRDLRSRLRQSSPEPPAQQAQRASAASAATTFHAPKPAADAAVRQARPRNPVPALVGLVIAGAVLFAAFATRKDAEAPAAMPVAIEEAREPAAAEPAAKAPELVAAPEQPREQPPAPPAVEQPAVEQPAVEQPAAAAPTAAAAEPPAAEPAPVAPEPPPEAARAAVPESPKPAEQAAAEPASRKSSRRAARLQAKRAAAKQEALAAAAPAAAPAAEPTPATAAPSAEPATKPDKTPLEAAIECVGRGDNACVVAALEGHARTARELELLIETYRAMGKKDAVDRNMRTYVSRFPQEKRAASYRLQLEPAPDATPPTPPTPPAPATPTAPPSTP